MTENKNINSIVSALIEGHHRMDVEWTKHFCDKEKYPQPEPEHIILAKTLDEYGFKQEIKARWIENPTFGFEEQYTGSIYICNNCEYSTYEDDFKYCPNCGAKMEDNK
jgi:rubrerythrin